MGFFGGKFLVQGFLRGLTFAHIRSSSSLEIRTPTPPGLGLLLFSVLGLSFINFFVCLFVSVTR